MRYLLAILAGMLALSVGPQAHSQGVVKQSGTITPRHLPMWTTNGVIMDAGSAAGGKAGTNPTTLGLTATGTPFCITDAPTTGPYHQLCFGALSLGGGLISYQAYNGATPEPVNCIINGSFIADCLTGGGGGLVPGLPSLSLQFNNGGVFAGYVIGNEFSASGVPGSTFDLKAFTGDVAKALGSVATTVVGLQGRPVSAALPLPGQVLGWTGSTWFPTTVTGGSGITQLLGPVTAGPGSGPQTATITPTGVTAGSYTLATSGGAFYCATFNPAGQATSIVPGACGGGGSCPSVLATGSGFALATDTGTGLGTGSTSCSGSRIALATGGGFALATGGGNALGF